jgi:hypothetical protein
MGRCLEMVVTQAPPAAFHKDFLLGVPGNFKQNFAGVGVFCHCSKGHVENDVFSIGTG